MENAVEVTSIENWLKKNLKIQDVNNISYALWLSLPQQHLLQFTAGVFYHDSTGELTHIKEILSWYPNDVWLWILASQWYLIGNNEPLIERAEEVGDNLGAQLIIDKLIRYGVEMWFLLNRQYRPYDKWLGSAFSHIDENKTLSMLINSVRAEQNISGKLPYLHQLIMALGKRQNELNICGYREPAYDDFKVGIDGAVRPFKVFNAGDFKNACIESIKNKKLKDMICVGAIDQLTHAGDALINFSNWSNALMKIYQSYLD
jgi:hypothetical protein